MLLGRAIPKKQIDMSQSARSLDLPNATDPLSGTVKLHTTGLQPAFTKFLAEHQLRNQARVDVINRAREVIIE